jgi:hypothetical protein
MSRGVARLCVVAGLLVAAAFPPAPALGAPAELNKLRVLLVIDTNSSLKDSIVVDRARMEALLVNGIPRPRYQLETLSGSEVTRTRILSYFQNLKADRSDALLFYYAGHGAVDPRRGQYFYLQEGKTDPLTRTDLRRAMTQTQVGLAVILTDCCSNHLKIPKRRSLPQVLLPAGQIRPVVRCLLFQSRGVVDITAASDNSAWGDEEEGGIFTRTLARLMLGDPAKLDADHDGFVSWKEFFGRLDRETQTTFVSWARQAKARGDVVDQGSQRPHAFELPGGNGSARETSYAVVGLRNDTPTVVHYQYRWSAQDAWKSSLLGPRSTIPRFYALAGRVEALPALEIRLESTEKTARLEAKRWTGIGPPSYEDGTKYKVASKSRKLRHLDVDAPDDQQKDAPAGKTETLAGELPPDEAGNTPETPAPDNTPNEVPPTKEKTGAP